GDACRRRGQGARVLHVRGDGCGDAGVVSRQRDRRSRLVPSSGGDHTRTRMRTVPMGYRFRRSRTAGAHLRKVTTRGGSMNSEDVRALIDGLKALNDDYAMNTLGHREPLIDVAIAFLEAS